MRCLRVRLVTGPREAQGISRDDNKTVPRVSSGGRVVNVPPLRFAKAPKSSKSRAERPSGEPVSLTRIRVPRLRRGRRFDLLAFSALRPLWGNGKREKGRPGAQLNRDAERWLLRAI